MDSDGFKKTSLNTVNRYRNRGKYDFETVHTIIDQTPILHLAFSPTAINGESDTEAWFPTVLPMMGCTGDYANRETTTRASPQSIYLHGYVSARLMRVAAAAGDDQDGKDTEGAGLPVSVAATLLDGVVLALTPNHHSCNYRSAVAFGRAHAVTDAAERLWALERITDNLVPGRWAATRAPSAAELRRTGVLRVDVVSASAKVRAGTTGEDRADLADDVVRRRVWAGVVPAHLVWAVPVPAPTNRVDPVPDYLDAWRRHQTDQARAYAVAAASVDLSAKKNE